MPEFNESLPVPEDTSGDGQPQSSLEDQMARREFLKKMGGVLGTAAALVPGVLSAEEKKISTEEEKEKQKKETEALSALKEKGARVYGPSIRLRGVIDRGDQDAPVLVSIQEKEWKGNVGELEKYLADISGDFILNIHHPSRSIDDTTVEAFSDLEGMQKHLQGLMLRGSESHFSDVSLKNVKKLKQLERFIISSPTITDAGLAHIKGLKALERLYVSGKQITNKGLEHLEDLTKLKRIGLSGTSIDGTGLAHLASHRELEELRLENNMQINDATLNVLRQHIEGGHWPKLRAIFLSGTNLTLEKVKEFDEEHPGIKVSFKPLKQREQ